MGAEFILKTHIFGAFNNGRSKYVGTLFLVFQIEFTKMDKSVRYCTQSVVKIIREM